MSEVLLSILAAAVSIVAGGFAGSLLELVRNLSKKNTQQPASSYSRKIGELTRSLMDASCEVDRVLEEMSEVSRRRETSISELESRVNELAGREKSMQEEILSLEQVSLPAVKAFVSEVERVERRSAWRDKVLFGLGVMVSTLVTIVLKLVFGI